MSEENKTKLLLALYSKTQLSYLKRNLEEKGLEVITATDGIQVIEKTTSIHPDCILICTDLPIIDAYSVTRIIKNTNYLSNIAVVICALDGSENYDFWINNSKGDSYCSLSDTTIDELADIIEKSIQKIQSTEVKEKEADSGRQVSTKEDFIKLLSEAYNRELFDLYVTKNAYDDETVRYDLKMLVKKMCLTLKSLFDYDALALIIKHDRIIEIYSLAENLPKEEINDFTQIARVDFSQTNNNSTNCNWNKTVKIIDTFETNDTRAIKIRSYEKFPLEFSRFNYTAHIALHTENTMNPRTRNRLDRFINTYIPLIEKTLEYNKMMETERKIEKSFSRFLPQTVIKKIIAEDNAYAETVGEKRKIAILMADIRNFTAISEKNTPENVVVFLNMFFAKMGKIIIKHGGTIDKFMGDAIMALFGAPESYIYNGNRAANAALEMTEAIKEIDTSLLNLDGNSFKVGIGINYGSPIAGTIGSEEKKEYTVIGDDVNIASRVESLTKLYGTEILITESVKKDIDSVLEAEKEKTLLKTEEASIPHLIRHIDNVKVKGKSKAVKLYEINTNVNKYSDFFLENYQKGLNQYEMGNFKTAEEYFQKAYSENSCDNAASVMLKRCKEFLLQKPENWDGAISLKIK